MKGNTITSVLIIAGTAVGAALVGLLGAYVVLPSVVPSVDAGTEANEAVASAADSTARRARRPDTTRVSGAPKSAQVAGDTSASTKQSMPERRQETGRSGTKTMTASSSGRADRGSTNASVVRALRDSIRSLQSRLRTVQQTADTLRDRTARLRQKLAAAADERAKVNELSDALMDMRRRGLSNLLQDVDMRVLRKLYQETTGGARTRLLQSMDPARAAKFVNQVVEEEAADSSSASPPAADAVPASE
ncbi:MAG: hypothetical protein ABEL51_12905 [Salinibacter sp.]